MSKYPLPMDVVLLCLAVVFQATNSCLTLCDPTDYSTTGFPVLHFLLKFAHINVHWYYPTISSSANAFSCPQSFPASGSFPMSWLFASHGQTIGASASVIPVTIEGWFPLGMFSLIFGLIWFKQNTSYYWPFSKHSTTHCLYINKTLGYKDTYLGVNSL